MNAIEAASVRVRTMADGTLRAELDFEPRYAAAAFELLGSPGQAVAVAGLKAPAPEAEKPKGGVAAKWLGMRCAEPEFQQWLAKTYPADALSVRRRLGADRAKPQDIAAAIVRSVCEVESRAEIDNDTAANERFQRLRGDWIKYQGSKA